MSRYKHFGYARDGHGHVISNATVSVYEAGGNTAASIYSNNSGGTAVNSVESSNNGLYAFYVDSNNYNSTQKFKVSIAKSGYTTTTVDDVLIMPVETITSANASSGVSLTTPNVLNVSNSTWTQVQFTTAVYDIGSDYNNSTYVFIAPATGYYLYTGSAYYTDPGETDVIQISWYKNNSTEIGPRLRAGRVPTYNTANVMSTGVANLTANDTLEMKVYITSDGNLASEAVLTNAFIWRLA